ncbi:hypothetical protein Mapa_016613 [Marchantia paleacea]|nr:hypothetical protein Mapa_016613 [Marchantia paleacea]
MNEATLCGRRKQQRAPAPMSALFSSRWTRSPAFDNGFNECDLPRKFDFSIVKTVRHALPNDIWSERVNDRGRRMRSAVAVAVCVSAAAPMRLLSASRAMDFSGLRQMVLRGLWSLVSKDQ